MCVLETQSRDPPGLLPRGHRVTHSLGEARGSVTSDITSSPKHRDSGGFFHLPEPPPAPSRRAFLVGGEMFLWGPQSSPRAASFRVSARGFPSETPGLRGLNTNALP